MSATTIQIKTTATQDETCLVAPYCPANNKKYRDAGGTWASDHWVFRGPAIPHAAKLIDDLFGQSEQVVSVTVPLASSHVKTVDSQILLGGYVLASRSSRDARAVLYAILAEGEIPPWGGSVKSPRVAASPDTVFEVVVRRDFAERLGLIDQPQSVLPGSYFRLSAEVGEVFPTSELGRLQSAIEVSISEGGRSVLLKAEPDSADRLAYEIFLARTCKSVSWEAGDRSYAGVVGERSWSITLFS